MNEIINAIENLTVEGYSANYISDYLSFDGIVMEPKEAIKIINDLDIERHDKKKMVRKYIKETCGKGSTIRSVSVGNGKSSRSSCRTKSY